MWTIIILTGNDTDLLSKLSTAEMDSGVRETAFL